jgi:phosphohistidine phosphatase
MRHAKAMQRSLHIFPDDSVRPLSEDGKKEHERISDLLKRMGIEFDVMVTSPYERAKETAKITRKAYNFKEKPKKWDELADGFNVDALLSKLSEMDPDMAVLLVGHEPYMGMLANALLRIEGNVDIDFKKSGVMCISFRKQPKRGEGTLEYFLKPKLLRVLAGGKKKGKKGKKVKGKKKKKKSKKAKGKKKKK